MRMRTSPAAVICGLLAMVVDGAESQGLINTMKHDIFVVTEKTFGSTIEKHRINGVATVLYYKSSDPKVKSLIDNVYHHVGKELNGMAKIAGLDCDAWTSFCDKQKFNQSYPLVVIYPPLPFPPIVHKGELTKSALVSATTRHIPGEKITLLSSQKPSVLERFLTANVAVPRAILFSDKESPPVLFKALSNSLNDRMSFGLVKKDDEELTKRFAVTKVPHLTLIKGEMRPGVLGEVYDGPLNFSALHQWLNVRSETFVKGGGYSTEEVTQESKPWLLQELPEMTGPSHQDICFKNNVLCAIFLSRSGEPSEETVNDLLELSKEYKRREPRIKFMFSWIDLSIETDFAALIGAASNTNSFVVFNPQKRIRFMKLAAKEEATVDNIRSLIETILGGNARFTNVKNQKLPPFAVRRQNREANKDEL